MSQKAEFRAWVKPGKMQYNVIPFTWDYCVNKMFFKCIKSNGAGILGSGGTEATWEVGGYAYNGEEEKCLTQYTGRQDKNEKKVFEGDILQSTIDEGLNNWLVERSDKYAGFVIVNIGVDGYLGDRFPIDSIYFFSDRVVIGNIYENPELLKP